jgi:hypothetical protein
MNLQHLLRLCLSLFILTAVSLATANAQHDFRALTPVEAAYFKKVNETIRKALPTQVSGLKLVNVDEPEADTKTKSMLADHPINKGEYVLFYSFEYGKDVDEIRMAAKLDDPIYEAQNNGDEAKERTLMEQLSKLVSEQRIYIDVAVNFGLLNFNYVKGNVQTLSVKDAVAYRSLYAEEQAARVPFIPGTYIGIGSYEAPKNMPYDGSEGGVFEVIAKKSQGYPDMSIKNVQIKIQGAPAIADQLIKQIDIAGLKAILGKKLMP